jgi:hypothetical protein
MHPSFRFYHALLAKTRGHETRPGSSQKPLAATGLGQSPPYSSILSRLFSGMGWVLSHQTTFSENLREA